MNEHFTEVNSPDIQKYENSSRWLRMDEVFSVAFLL
jgi:hypothetical protein